MGGSASCTIAHGQEVTFYKWSGFDLIHGIKGNWGRAGWKEVLHVIMAKIIINVEFKKIYGVTCIEHHSMKLVHQRKHNLQQQRLHVSLYKIQFHQEMFVQVLP